MDTTTGDTVVGFMMAVFGVVGLILASGAHDDAMYVFGWALSGFSVLFISGLIKGHCDLQDRLRSIRAKGDHHV